MSSTLPRPVLTVYRRAECSLCDDLRPILQAVLEERAARSELTPTVREVDISGDPDFELRYGGLVPVLTLDGRELPLAMSARNVRAFLQRAMPAVV